MPAPDPHLAIRPMIIGADGLVGGALAALLEPRFPHTVSATRTELDIADRWATEWDIERLDPTVVINTAAVAANLAAICRRGRRRLIHLSTDYVFDGLAGREYEEADLAAPVNEYGRSKLRGEEAILAGLADAVVLRISFVFGPGRETFFDKIARQAVSGGGPIRVIDGWVTKPTYNRDIARAVLALLEDPGASGLFHFANAGAVSRFAFAREVVRLAGGDPARVEPVAPESLDLPAARPAATPLATVLFAARFGWAPRPWTDAAREYLAEFPPRAAS
ncbi:MAG: NAD(P)-dependent oxidoreductase [Acidobacteria bacterium]|nr:NAD(P)-dependent oxidoreductase [Acidobacteriota bacterium]